MIYKDKLWNTSLWNQVIYRFSYFFSYAEQNPLEIEAEIQGPLEPGKELLSVPAGQQLDSICSGTQGWGSEDSVRSSKRGEVHTGWYDSTYD